MVDTQLFEQLRLLFGARTRFTSHLCRRLRLLTCCAKQYGSKPHSLQKTNEIDARHVRRFYFWWTASRHEKTIARSNGDAGDRRRGGANLESALTLCMWRDHASDAVDGKD